YAKHVPILFLPDLQSKSLVHLLPKTELLDGEIFYTLREAQILIERWRKHYNTVRPHSSLGYRPPAPESIVPVDRRPTMH
ncbi:transposase, partial [Limimaricola sp. G21655-S1]|uniref:integrase core domain-containing protein n=1 Tax=Limimaricola sp. G21655-S1 TaxID=3014768 RepID=UPI0022AEE3CA